MEYTRAPGARPDISQSSAHATIDFRQHEMILSQSHGNCMGTGEAYAGLQEFICHASCIALHRMFAALHFILERIYTASCPPIIMVIGADKGDIDVINQPYRLNNVGYGKH